MHYGCFRWGEAPQLSLQKSEEAYNNDYIDSLSKLHVIYYICDINKIVTNRDSLIFGAYESGVCISYM